MNAAACRRALPLAPLAAAALAAGCGDRLLRENVFANTETMIGLQLAQDPRSQMYEARAGFARHELFIVPTGKRVSDQPGAAQSDLAERTPEVLGEIMVDGALPGAPGGSGIGVGVYQRLAVGPLAVSQPAAIALFARVEPTAAAAFAARDFGPDAASERLRRWLELDPANRARLNAWLERLPEADRPRIPVLLNAASCAALRARAAAELNVPGL